MIPQSSASAVPVLGGGPVTETRDPVSGAIDVRHGDDPLCRLLPVSAAPARPGPGPASGELSELTVVRRRGPAVVLESPLAWCAVEVPDLAPLASAGPVWDYLRWAGVAETSGPDPGLADAQWTPHEMWFHHHTRVPGPHRDPAFGRSRWADGRFAPLPARHERFTGPGIPLAVPDLRQLRETDPSLTTVLESRRSVREHDDERPIDVTQLGHLLHRCARNRWLVARAGTEYLSRPYPSGGSAYELEIYPVVRRVTGLEPAVYHYDPQGHAVHRVSGRTGELLADATAVAGSDGPPQVLLVVTARFGRLMWTYRGMAYALVLKHVGVLQQTLGLVATAMGLAGCALGDGDAAAFAAASGTDPRTEASVGEFVLGSRPAQRRP